MFCTQCGRQNAADSKFCANCGAPLRTFEPAPEGPSEVTSTQIAAVGAPAAADGEFAPDLGAYTELSEADQSAVDGLPARSALLVVVRGPSAGSRYLLDSDVVSAGRHSEADIFLDDVTVSRRHAEFRRQDGGFSVHDVGSLNGTYVNRDRIDAVTLTEGDEVQIGKFRLMYFASREAPREPAGTEPAAPGAPETPREPGQ
jgi:hypothetical protein